MRDYLNVAISDHVAIIQPVGLWEDDPGGVFRELCARLMPGETGRGRGGVDEDEHEDLDRLFASRGRPDISEEFKFTAFLADFQHCEGTDEEFLGSLAKIAKALREGFSRRASFVAVNVDDDTYDLMRELRVDRLIALEDACPRAPRGLRWEAVQPGRCRADAMDSIDDALENLWSLAERNQDEFPEYFDDVEDLVLGA